ncbi:probable cyclin-dependent serine/threonine-protein kinase DDB_G0292550 [Boleophthalmus pectinirostris]|uniref:probable cyclin-dependent serine/threonine-protein kinase DDB_G0292550 n=1 Tax=Boleophthalmus pectinirostris TaxID=150288 RepID=UPI00242EB06E|nr:probable cyclin-dependent serine/threonine-protein kinase DDB_G0292550 [Boleophthalmus pectinirostris]
MKNSARGPYREHTVPPARSLELRTVSRVLHEDLRQHTGSFEDSIFIIYKKKKKKKSNINKLFPFTLQIVVVKASGQVFVNYIESQQPLFTADFSLYKMSNMYMILEIRMGLQLVIQLQPVLQVFAIADAKLKEKMLGLCGNFNDKELDDYKVMSGLVESTSTAFANAWKTQANCPDISTQMQNPCSQTITKESYGDYWCSKLTEANGVFAKCHSAVSPEPYMQRCKHMVCEGEKSEDSMCASVSSYILACSQAGVHIKEWRDTICAKFTECPMGTSYSYNMTSCHRSCRSLSQFDYTCQRNLPVLDGCGCMEGTYMNPQGQCVQSSECPCYDKDDIISPGQSINKDGNTCVCRDGVLSCIGGNEQDNSSKCASPMVYFDCSTAPAGSSGVECQKSCGTLDMACLSSGCTSGCMCPEGLVSDGAGDCIEESKCPCLHNGKVYQSGETLKVDCNTCYCSNRKFSCTSNVCDAVCSVYGDGHYTTFDDKRYDFNGQCQYTLLQDYCGGSNGTFRIISENMPCGTTGTTCFRVIKIYLGEAEYQFREEKFHVVKSSSKFGPPQMQKMGLYLVVTLKLGMVVMWDMGTTFFIKLHPVFQGSVCGLCGNYDGKSANDYTTRSLELVNDVLEFGNSWKVSTTCPNAQLVQDPCLTHPYRLAWAQKQCSIINSITFQSCHSQVDPGPYFDSCVRDSCACDTGGDCECLCTAVAVYARVCNEAGVCVRWRTPKLCPVFCDYYNAPEGCEWHYKPCGADCMKTCRNPSGNCSSLITAIEGCYPQCPPSEPFFDEDSMKCVTREKCGCFDDNDNHYTVGESVPSSNCYTCTCTDSGIKCSYNSSSCKCFISGKIYNYGEIVYNTTDGLGNCITAECGEDGTIQRKLYPCTTTTTAVPTTFVFTTTVPATTETATSTTTVVGNKYYCSSEHDNSINYRNNSIYNYCSSEHYNSVNYSNNNVYNYCSSEHNNSINYRNNSIYNYCSSEHYNSVNYSNNNIHNHCSSEHNNSINYRNNSIYNYCFSEHNNSINYRNNNIYIHCSCEDNNSVNYSNNNIYNHCSSEHNNSINYSNNNVYNYCSSEHNNSINYSNNNIYNYCSSEHNNSINYSNNNVYNYCSSEHNNSINYSNNNVYNYCSSEHNNSINYRNNNVYNHCSSEHNNSVNYSNNNIYNHCSSEHNNSINYSQTTTNNNIYNYCSSEHNNSINYRNNNVYNYCSSEHNNSINYSNNNVYNYCSSETLTTQSTTANNNVYNHCSSEHNNSINYSNNNVYNCCGKNKYYCSSEHNNSINYSNNNVYNYCSSEHNNSINYSNNNVYNYCSSEHYNSVNYSNNNVYNYCSSEHYNSVNYSNNNVYNHCSSEHNNSINYSNNNVYNCCVNTNNSVNYSNNNVYNYCSSEHNNSVNYSNNNVYNHCSSEHNNSINYSNNVYNYCSSEHNNSINYSNNNVYNYCSSEHYNSVNYSNNNVYNHCSSEHNNSINYSNNNVYNYCSSEHNNSNNYRNNSIYNYCSSEHNNSINYRNNNVYNYCSSEHNNSINYRNNNVYNYCGTNKYYCSSEHNNSVNYSNNNVYKQILLFHEHNNSINYRNNNVYNCCGTNKHYCSSEHNNSINYSNNIYNCCGTNKYYCSSEHNNSINYSNNNVYNYCSGEHNNSINYRNNNVYNYCSSEHYNSVNYSNNNVYNHCSSEHNNSINSQQQHRTNNNVYNYCSSEHNNSINYRNNNVYNYCSIINYSNNNVYNYCSSEHNNSINYSNNNVYNYCSSEHNNSINYRNNNVYNHCSSEHNNSINYSNNNIYNCCGTNKYYCSSEHNNSINYSQQQRLQLLFQ